MMMVFALGAIAINDRRCSDMKRMKQYTAYAIVAMLVLSLLGSGAVYAASGNQQIGAGSVSGKAGTTLEVPIAVGSEGQVSAIQFRLDYDSNKLELTEVKKGAGLPSAFSVISNAANGKVVIGSLGSTIVSGTKEVARAVFKIKADAASGQYEVRLADVMFSDSDAGNLTSQFQVVAGTVTVVNPDFVLTTGLTIAPTALNLTVGGAAGTLTATVAPANATNKTVTWRSSDTNVATVAGGVITPAGVGTATITATTADGSHTATAVVKVQAGGAPSFPVQPGTSPQPEDQTADVDVIVNGKAESAGTATTTTVNERRITTVTVDASKLETRLASEADGAVITIPARTAADVIIGELDGQMVKNMERKQAVVEIATDRAIYTLPAQQINIEAVSGQFGADVKLADIKLRIGVAEPTADQIELAANAAAAGEFTLLVPPLEFTVTAVYGDRTVEISKFDAYIERKIAIPAGVDHTKITTSVVVEADGTVRHAPTKIVRIDGQYYALVSSLTNSTYALVANAVTFRDVVGHWSEQAVSDMGARMIVGGVGKGLFSPDQAITRAEFAAIIVRGLGLKPEGGGVSAFPDVSATAWYSGAVQTAHASGLISGFGDGTFRPLDKITREQAMVITANAMSVTGLKAKLPAQAADESLRSFADVGDVAGWARTAIADSVQAGVVSGGTGGKLAPKAPITRAEVAAIVQRLLRKSGLI